MFRKILITSIASIGLVSAMHANAHTVHNHSNNHHQTTPAPKITYNINVNINLLLTLITNGVKNNSLTHNEEKLCRDDYNRISKLRTNYNRGGIQYHEHRQLEKHIKNAQKRVRDYSKNNQRRVIKKKQKPVVHHHQTVIINEPVVRWAPPVRKHRPHRRSRMNRYQRRMMRCIKRGGKRCGNRKGVAIKHSHGAILNKHVLGIVLDH